VEPYYVALDSTPAKENYTPSPPPALPMSAVSLPPHLPPRSLLSLSSNLSRTHACCLCCFLALVYSLSHTNTHTCTCTHMKQGRGVLSQIDNVTDNMQPLLSSKKTEQTWYVCVREHQQSLHHDTLFFCVRP